MDTDLGQPRERERRRRLREIGTGRADGEGLLRRWYHCGSADLYLWQDAAGIAAFEFCYGKPADEHVLRWQRAGTVRHARIDDGESGTLSNRTPILVADGHVDRETLALAFEQVGAEVDPVAYRLVLLTLHRV